jgi:glycosyltransferase involved in cell wall biosynthesis
VTRVAQVMAGAAEGGAELFFERLCIALHRAGESVLPAIRRNPGRAAFLRQAGLAPAEFAFGPPIDLLTRPRLRASLAGFAPDIAIFWMNRANQHAPRGDWISVGRLGGYYDLKYYRDRDHLVGNTRGIVAWLRRQGWPDSRTHYLPNFAEDFADASPADRAALAIPPGHRLLLGLGRLHTDKGFDTLIRALPAIGHATLAIAGAGPEHEALTALARREGVADRVRFLGWRRDAGALLKAADVFVCSSRVEPLGNMVLEAWSASRAVVAAAADGPAELIAHGRDGLVVPREDPRALADAISRVLDDAALADALAVAGRARFLDAFAAAPVLAAWRGFLGGLTA